MRLVERDGEVQSHCRLRRIAPKRVAIGIDGLGESPQPGEDDTEIRPRLDVVGVVGEKLTVRGGGALEVPGVLQRDRALDDLVGRGRLRGGRRAEQH